MLCIWGQLLSCVWLFSTPRTVACQASLSMEFSGKEYWSGLPFPSPGDLSDPGIELTSLVSPALADSLPLCHLESLKGSYANLRIHQTVCKNVNYIVHNFLRMRWAEDLFRYTKAERFHHQQTYTTRNIEGDLYVEEYDIRRSTQMCLISYTKKWRSPEMVKIKVNIKGMCLKKKSHV